MGLNTYIWSLLYKVSIAIFGSLLFLSVHFLLLLIFFIQVISQLRILGRSATAGCKFDREVWSNELSPVLNLWKKLNQVSTGY